MRHHIEGGQTMRCLKDTVHGTGGSWALLKPCTVSWVAVTSLSVHQGKKEAYVRHQLWAGCCHYIYINNSQTPDMCTQFPNFCSLTLLYTDFHAICDAWMPECMAGFESMLACKKTWTCTKPKWQATSYTPLFQFPILFWQQWNHHIKLVGPVQTSVLMGIDRPYSVNWKHMEKPENWASVVPLLRQPQLHLSHITCPCDKTGNATWAGLCICINCDTTLNTCFASVGGTMPYFLQHNTWWKWFANPATQEKTTPQLVAGCLLCKNLSWSTGK